MLRIEEAYKQFNNGFLALENINLDIAEGEIVSLVGTSGCGKSTLLRIISGLDVPTSGQVYIDREPITKPHPAIGVVFQEPRLMPWLNVRDNVRFGLDTVPKVRRERLTETILDRVGLSNFACALPRQLSGGMAQRVAIARALVTNPAILLLDEPFSALDAFIRSALQNHLLEIWEYDRPTMVLVTHDLEEALVLSDRVIVMRGNPGHIYQEFRLDLPRPRKRTDLKFQQWKEKLLDAIDLSTQTQVPLFSTQT
ncbi:ABC transporter ATP-binding protein [Candidatus Gracilibacteria bacterium]|nr:ABC transporter ATP-binding protein [Candidatus Gracilibacteria bacterium]NJP21813.1 ABC transporter ATP-binding protein [Hydrococcus sp. CRU_1_1]NJQ97874.1 ABC transporter ATP-binding protein [Hydrococcus sp. CSU_1_8]